MREPELIHQAQSAEDYAAFAQLVREYVLWFGARYQQSARFVEQVFGFQGLEQELVGLAAMYGPPHGRTFLAVGDGECRGGGAYRMLADGSCEMKRLYVPERFQGRGIGRRLAETLIRAARADGYAVMRLDTGKRLTEAIALYRRLGFRECPPHRVYPPELMHHLAFLELSLDPEI
jgi:ribosomal protein S18 acetylase RimI-like enzyme